MMFNFNVTVFWGAASQMTILTVLLLFNCILYLYVTAVFLILFVILPCFECNLKLKKMIIKKKSQLYSVNFGYFFSVLTKCSNDSVFRFLVKQHNCFQHW